MPSFWYASFVFLGLSLSIGLLIYILHKERNKTRKGKHGHGRPGSKDAPGQSKSLLKDLEDQYGKKG
jgi:hypothetical protein